ncbi:fasciclin domain-containing protein [Actinomadura sp. DC4]|uniref:fasciclin domain-containing protein n=1 Tax=Actinomadura sp. DC4 TaxID=3055069 RepID=UPI0025B12884|nr:fasciclin domain-containing protein [Actinomadura sp. DC4]MDN3351564.1 fasciclin domain-containing protein [Actinomadura sp. DC4]
MNTRVLAASLVAGGLLVSAAACGSDDKTDDKGASASAPAGAGTTSSAAMPDKPFGAGCSAVPTSGKGSFSGMSADPVATAASNNPALSTLVTAVKKAGLVDTLNSAPNLTVFAPSNDAFKKIPPKTLKKVLADKKQLSSILTYHVIGQRVAPTAMASGSFKSLQGGMVTTSGSGESYKVNDANVVCGNVQTANATVYIIDTVLMPKM